MKRLRALLLSLLAMALAYPGYAEVWSADTSVNVRLYNVRNGLIAGDVVDMEEDEDGVMWVATLTGISRFDGEGFQNFASVDTLSPRAPFGSPKGLCFDRRGQLWIGTSSGITRYNEATRLFHHYPYPDSLRHLFSNNTWADVGVDARGAVWMIGDRLIGRYSVEHDGFLFYPNGVTPRERGNHKVKIVRAPSGQLWVLVGSWLYQLDSDYGRLIPIEINSPHFAALGAKHINAAEAGPNGGLWISTDTQLVRYDTETKRVRTYKLPTLPYPIIALEDISIAPGGTLWALTKRGIARFNRQNERWTVFSRLYGNAGQNVYTAEYAILASKNNDIWFSAPSGLASWSTRTNYFTHYLNRVDGKPLFKDQRIRSLVSQGDSILWIGTWTGGITRLELQTRRTTHYGVDEPTHPIPSDWTSCLTRLQDGTLVAVLWNYIVAYNPTTGQWKDLFATLGSRNYPGWRWGDGLRGIHEDGDGNLWIHGNGVLAKYNRANDQMSFVRGVEGLTIYALVAEASNAIWFGTQRGLFLIRSENGTPQQVAMILEDGSISQTDAVYAVMMGEHRTIWAGSDRGLFRKPDGYSQFESTLENFHSYAHTVYSIEFDADGDVWLSTDQGLIEFDPILKKANAYDILDGPVGMEYNPMASTVTDRGRVFFGGMEGLIGFNGQRQKEPPRRPPLEVSACIALGPNGNEYLPIPSNRLVYVSPNYKVITIVLSMVDFNRYARTKYQYRVKGLVGEWTNIQAGNIVSLAELPEGAHHFEYRAMVAHNEWVEGEPLNVVIEKPFYWNRTSRAAYGIILVLVAAFWFVNRWGSAMKLRMLIRDKEKAVQFAEQQRKQADEHNKSVNDSIKYAYRVQMRVMPSGRELSNFCPENFLLYKPRDIVSGDFCWIAKTKGLLVMAVVDCTGHGVPGALMAIIGALYLNSIVCEQGNTNPAVILELLNKMLLERSEIGIEGEDGLVLNDGMDLSLCTVDTEQRTVTFAGGFHTLYHASPSGVETIRGDLVFTGAAPNAKYKAHTFRYTSDDMIYMLSDGYLDQLGGVRGEKYKSLRFRQLIESLHMLPAAQQKEHLERTLEAWQGDNAQVDDITIFGTRCNFRV